MVARSDPIVGRRLASTTIETEGITIFAVEHLLRCISDSFPSRTDVFEGLYYIALNQQ